MTTVWKTSSKADKLLQGAIDLHCHGYPEISIENRVRLGDWEAFSHAAAAGLRAMVLKSHTWPTMGRAHLLNHQLPDIKILGSTTLNCSCGGVSLWVAEMAVREGARMIWMPTWSARFDIDRGGFIRYMRKHVASLEHFSGDDGITILTSDGSPIKSVKEILTLASQLGIPVSTGHLSPMEALAMAEEARNVGMNRLIFGHPISRANRNEIKSMARLGAYIELTALSIMPPYQRVKPMEMAEIIREIGAEHCILTSDAFYEWSPPPAELLRILIASLLALGLEEEEVKVMVQKNPAAILGLEST